MAPGTSLRPRMGERGKKVNQLSYVSTRTLVSLPSMGSIVVYLHKECAVVGVLGELPRLLAHLEEVDFIESSKTRTSLETIMLVFWSGC
jgi:hypothetical protein